MTTANEAIELLKKYAESEEEGETEVCFALCNDLISSKKANNLECNLTVDEEEDPPIFPEYLDELVDILDDDQAVKFHAHIAYDLVEEDYINLYGFDLDQISACSPSFTLGGLIKLWKRTYHAPEVNESEIVKEGESFKLVDVIPRSYVVIGDAFYFYEVFNGIDDNPDINKDFAIAVLFQYSYDAVDEKVNAYQDFEYILSGLTNPEVLDAVILEGYSNAIYAKSNLEIALKNISLSEDSLSFMFDFCSDNDLGDYDCYESYEEKIDEERESLEDGDLLEFFKGIIEHPNVTQEILKQLTESEYEEIEELARQKLSINRD